MRPGLGIGERREPRVFEPSAVVARTPAAAKKRRRPIASLSRELARDGASNTLGRNTFHSALAVLSTGPSCPFHVNLPAVPKLRQMTKA